MTAGEILIRAPGADDRAAWNRLWQGYLEFYRSSLDSQITATP